MLYNLTPLSGKERELASERILSLCSLDTKVASSKCVASSPSNKNVEKALEAISKIWSPNQFTQKRVSTGKNRRSLFETKKKSCPPRYGTAAHTTRPKILPTEIIQTNTNFQTAENQPRPSTHERRKRSCFQSNSTQPAISNFPMSTHRQRANGSLVSQTNNDLFKLSQRDLDVYVLPSDRKQFKKSKVFDFTSLPRP